MASYLQGYRHARTKVRTPAPFEPATEFQKATFLRHYKAGLHAGEARKKAELTKALFNHALVSDPDFVTAIEEVDEFFLDKLEDVVMSMAHKGDMATARWLLEKRRPEKYGQKSKVEVSHRFQSVEDIRKLSDEDILAEFKRMGIEDKP